MFQYYYYRQVIGFDVDDDALSICRQNIKDFELTNVDLVQCNLDNEDLMSLELWNNHFDTVVMNPPFGTKKNKGRH